MISHSLHFCECWSEYDRKAIRRSNGIITIWVAFRWISYTVRHGSLAHEMMDDYGFSYTGWFKGCCISTLPSGWKKDSLGNIAMLTAILLRNYIHFYADSISPVKPGKSHYYITY
jgi:putative component of membrane protein insertase Oxa1/YidC/SpoIIIJ protein YidD